MRGLLFACSVLFLVFFATVEGKRALVIVDDMSIKDTHSIFFDLQTARGYQLDFFKPTDGIKFQDYGEFHYDSLILFAPLSEVWSENKLSTTDVLNFIDSGAGNVLIASDNEYNYFIETIAKENGILFGDSGDAVVDHMHFFSGGNNLDHNLILADQFAGKGILGNKEIAPVLYQGNGLLLSKSNRLVFPILTGDSTAYLSSNDGSFPSTGFQNAGHNLVLVAGLQARNNARVVVSGSLSLFSNNFIQQTVNGAQSGNLEFVNELSRWNFGDRGVIRIKSITHRRVGDSQPSPFYTVNDELEYSIEIEEWNGSEWKGYNANDVQLSVKMLDPYIRKTLTPNGNGLFSTQFKAPDVYGVFTFEIDYHRVGYSSLFDDTLITIRPYRHDEYERFIDSAFPYYASAFSMMGGVALFAALFLFSK